MATQQQAWNDRKGLALPPPVKAKAKAALKAAADWAVRNQRRHAWPAWDADAGRFLYHVYLPTGDHFWSNSWNTARCAQGLIGANRVLGNAEYLAAAERGLDYVKTLQVFAPEHPKARGAFLEETPQSDHVGPRDGIECTQALMAHHLITGDRASLLRAGAYLDWLMGHMTPKPQPLAYCYLKPKWSPSRASPTSLFLLASAAVPLTQYAAVTGKKSYLTRGAVPLIDTILDVFQHASGGLSIPSRMPNRHIPVAGSSFVYNDDGAGVAILCVWAATGKRKYLDAAAAFGDWWLSQDADAFPPVFALLPSLALFLADLARATGDRRYTDYVAAFSDRLFDLQMPPASGSLVAGAFRGEDMAIEYRKGARDEDFIAQRTTSYALLALSKLAAGNDRQWGPAYSAFWQPIAAGV